MQDPQDYYYIPISEEGRFPHPFPVQPDVDPARYSEQDYLFALELNFTVLNDLANGNDTNVTFGMPFLSLDDLLSEFRASLFVYRESRNAILIAVYVPLFLLATVCNIMVVVVVYRYRRIRSITNCLLVNLSVADLMVTWVCMPMAIGTNVYRPWVYGDVMCKLVTYMEGVAVSSSVFTLTAMSIDRYVAIRHPMKFRKVFNRSLVLRVICGVWFVAICLFLPVLFVRRTEGFYVRNTNHRFVFCVERWPRDHNRRLYSSFLFVVVYAVPGQVLLLAYSMMGCTLRRSEGDDPRSHAAKVMSGRRKIARIMLVLALTFALCWLPYNILMLVLDLELRSQLRDSIIHVLPFTLLLGHANSAINPILYCFLAKSFRMCIKDALCPWWNKHHLGKERLPLKSRNDSDSVRPDNTCLIRLLLGTSSSSSRSMPKSTTSTSGKCRKSTADSNVDDISAISSTHSPTGCCHRPTAKSKTKRPQGYESVIAIDSGDKRVTPSAV